MYIFKKFHDKDNNDKSNKLKYSVNSDINLYIENKSIDLRYKIVIILILSIVLFMGIIILILVCGLVESKDVKFFYLFLPIFAKILHDAIKKI